MFLLIFYYFGLVLKQQWNRFLLLFDWLHLLYPCLVHLHYLPEEEWAGWEEDVDLDSVRVKLIKKANLDFSEFDVWDADIERANAYGEIPLPKINRQENPAIVKQRLKQLLGRQGLREIDIQTSYATRQSRVQLALKEDARRRVRGQMEKQLREE